MKKLIELEPSVNFLSPAQLNYYSNRLGSFTPLAMTIAKMIHIQRAILQPDVRNFLGNIQKIRNFYEVS